MTWYDWIFPPESWRGYALCGAWGAGCFAGAIPEAWAMLAAGFVFSLSWKLAHIPIDPTTENNNA